MSIIFIAIFVLMFGADLAWAVAIRRVFAGDGRIRLVRRAALLFVAAMAVTLALTMFGRFVGVRIDSFLPRVLVIAFFVWHFLGLGAGLIAGVLYLTGVAAARIGKLVASRARTPADAEAAPRLDSGDTALSRRAFLARATVLAPAVVTAGATDASLAELNQVRIRELEVPIRDLPSGIDGMTIAHVSDVHLGQFTTAATFRRIVQATNDLDADLVLQTGDLINFDQRDLPVAAELTHALRGRYGQFMCEGNHDLIEGRESFERFVRGARLPILIDEASGVEVNGVPLCILGLQWQRPAPGASLDALLHASVARLAAKRSAGFSILLAHHPHAFDAARAHALPLTLAGHTHGGQLHLSRTVGFGPLMYRYWSGVYAQDGAACAVSNGAGNWFPLRINAPAEILRLTLRRA